MDFIDEGITRLLMDGKTRTFDQILHESGVSHNTLRLHLDELAERDLITRLKVPNDRRGRPKFAYGISANGRRACEVGVNQVTGVVSLAFTGLSQVCRFEKGGFCKKLRRPCNASDCPQIR